MCPKVHISRGRKRNTRVHLVGSPGQVNQKPEVESWTVWDSLAVGLQCNLKVTILFFFLLYFTLQYCIDFAIHQHESAMGVHVLSILNPASHLPSHTISLGHPCWISLQSKGLSRIFSKNTVQKNQFFAARPSLWSNSHIHS